MQSATSPSLPIDCAAMALIPMMAFIGVLISCDIRERKLLFAVFACSAAASAAARISFCRCSSL